MTSHVLITEHNNTHSTLNKLTDTALNTWDTNCTGHTVHTRYIAHCSTYCIICQKLHTSHRNTRTLHIRSHGFHALILSCMSKNTHIVCLLYLRNHLKIIIPFNYTNNISNRFMSSNHINAHSLMSRVLQLTRFHRSFSPQRLA